MDRGVWRATVQGAESDTTEQPITAQHSPSSDIYWAIGQETILTHMYEFMST